jgi:hypothetical protein
MPIRPMVVFYYEAICREMLYVTVTNLKYNTTKQYVSPNFVDLP